MKKPQFLRRSDGVCGARKGEVVHSRKGAWTRTKDGRERQEAGFLRASGRTSLADLGSAAAFVGDCTDSSQDSHSSIRRFVDSPRRSATRASRLRVAASAAATPLAAGTGSTPPTSVAQHGVAHVIVRGFRVRPLDSRARTPAAHRFSS